jgi:hypothetical protein
MILRPGCGKEFWDNEIERRENKSESNKQTASEHTQTTPSRGDVNSDLNVCGRLLVVVKDTESSCRQAAGIGRITSQTSAMQVTIFDRDAPLLVRVQ